MNNKTRLSTPSLLAVAISTILAPATGCSPIGNASPVNHPEPQNVMQLTQVQPEERKNRSRLEAFAASYTYCDAKVLANYWGQEITDSKLRAGDQLLQGQRGMLETALQQARQRAKQTQKNTNTPVCQYDNDGGYTYDDAVLLAQYWGKPSAWEAKLKIEQLLLDGQNASIQTALQRAKQATAPRSSPSPQTSPDQSTQETAMITAYANSGYTYCDAKLLAAHWKLSEVGQSKLRIGDKLLHNNRSQVEKALTQARNQAKKQQQQTKQPACQYHTDGGYTYDDAVLLAQYWGKPSAWEAKLKIEQLLLDGQNASIQTALQRAKQTTAPRSSPSPQTSPDQSTQETAMITAYANGGYTYCDAKLLAAHWKLSEVVQSKLRIGDKLLHNHRSQVEKALTQARSQAKKQQQQTKQPACQYHTDGGYTYDDAVLLAQYWGKPSAWEAKLKIERLLLEGQDASIQKALQQAKSAATTTH